MNEERFSGKAEIYKKFRPSYPKELFDYLYSQAGFRKESVIADIGAGTGIFTRLLLERGSTVYAVEPNGDMRGTAEQDLAEYKKLKLIDAPAEKTGLADASVDFITVAQAFHWFDRDLFKSECQRILKPGGKVVLVWNERDYESEIVKKDYDIRKKYAADNKGIGRYGGFRHDYLNFFADGIYEYKTFNNDLQFDKESFTGRNLSASYAPREEKDPEKYQGLVRELGEFFDEYSVNGILNYPHYTQSFAGNI